MTAGQGTDVSDRSVTPSAPTARLGIVVVNYASSELLATNLAPLDLTGLPVRVVVVDNHSGARERDAVAALASAHGWRSVLLSDNRGFGAGVNAGVEAARAAGCDSFLLLNPDAQVTREVVADLHRAVQSAPDTMISPRVVAPDGSDFFRGAQVSLVDGRIRGHGPDGSRRLPTDQAEEWVSGAALVVHDRLLRRVGGLAEDYFLYWEDLDLAHRCLRAGGSLLVRTDLVAVHDAGGTQGPQRGRAKSALYYRYNCRNRLLFAATHLSRRRLLRWMVATPSVSWEVLRRGGRRQLVTRPSLAWAAVAGSAAGLAIAMLALVSRRPRTDPPTVLVAHPGAELYGSDRMVLEAVSGLVDAGRRVVVAVPADGPLVRELSQQGAEVCIVPTPVLRKSALSPRGLFGLAGETARGLLAAGRLVRRTRPTAVYVSTLTIPLWVLVGRVCGLPVTVHVHEAERSAARLVRSAMCLPVRLADQVLVNSRYSLDVLLESAPTLRGRAVVVPNGVAGPPVVHSPRTALEGPVRLLFVGRLSPRKGPHVAIGALGELHRRGVPATLVLAGSVFPGYEPFEQQLHEQVRSAGLSGSVSFLGFVDDVWSVLADCDVALVPSLLDEPFGNTAVEALLAARPVVASATSGLREATSGYRTARTVPPGELPLWADAVQSLVEDWHRVGQEVVEDAAEAAGRHAPERFRAQVAALTVLTRRGDR